MKATTFDERLAELSTATGLTPQQLGVTRVYDQPHVGMPQGDDYPASASQPDAQAHLAGEEVLIKDLQQVRGEACTMGSQSQHFIAPHHDSAALRLLRAGATLVGASATSEFGVTAYTEPQGHDAPINPIGAQFMPGGSSGGAAVVVARGLVDIAHATDGGGSIRIPAACCGLPGLKPAHDRTIGGFTPSSHGFIACDIETTARAYGLGTVQSHSGPVGMRIGYTNEPFHASTQVDPMVAAATASVTALLSSTDVVDSVSQAPRPYPRATFELFAQFLSGRCAPLPGDLTPITAWLRDQGRGISPTQRSAVARSLLGVRERVEQAWDQFDVIATPTLACPPPPPGAFSALPPRLNFLAQTAWTPWATLWNITGWAALSVPLVPATNGRWPVSLLLGAVSDRVSALDLLQLGVAVQRMAQLLPAEQLSSAQPGNVEALGFQPHPEAHVHGEPCGHH